MIVRAIHKILNEFVDSPYFFYSEHGYHARFVNILYENISSSKSVIWDGMEMAKIQNEFPTPNRLGRSKSQTWDLAILGEGTKVEAIIEFGLNANTEDVCLYNSAKRQGEKADLKWKTPHMLDDADRLFRARTEEGMEHRPYSETNGYHVELFRTGTDEFRDQTIWAELCGTGTLSRDRWTKLLAQEQKKLADRWRDSKAKNMEGIPAFSMAYEEIAKRFESTHVFVAFAKGGDRHMYELKPSDHSFVRVERNSQRSLA